MQQTPRGLAAFNQSIRRQLVLGTVLILALVVALLTALIARNATRQLEVETSARLSQLATQSGRAVSAFLDARATTVELWSADTLLLSVVRDPGLSAVFMPGLKRYIDRYAEREPWIANVLVTQSDEVVFALNETDADASQIFNDAEIQLVEVGAQSLLAIRRQAVDRGQPIDGVSVILFLDLAVMHELLLSEARVGRQGFSTLLSGIGRPLGPTPERLPTIGTLGPSEQALQRDGLLIEIRAVENAPLHVAAVATRADIGLPVRKLINVSILLGLGAIALGFVGTIYFTGRVTAPIRQLTTEARSQALARFGHSAPKGLTAGGKSRRYGDDEVGELASVFELLGRTTDDLTEANALLETRNADLSAARLKLRENLDRLERELDSARRLQLSMVPDQKAAASLGENVDIAALMEPAREVGGDFYDFLPVGDRSVSILIGDVSDKGTPSALFMARTISLLRYTMSQDTKGALPDVATIMANVNDELCKDNKTRMFVTLFIAIADLDTGRLTYVNAGHPSPVVQTEGRAVLMSDAAPDLPLGVRSGAQFTTGSFQLDPGARVLLYTDGVSEAENVESAFYGTTRLLRAATGAKDAAALIDSVKADLSEFSAGAEQFDDITMLALGWRPIG